MSALSRPAFWLTGVLVIIADILTKRLAMASLDYGVPRDIIGDWLRFTLVFNRGAAFGTTVGDASRWIFTGLALVILFVLIRMARQARPEEGWKLFALGMICGGAIGNLVDRLRWTNGVVDFVDVGIGGHRFWVFNVADSAVSVGAVLLVLILWAEERRTRSVAA
ncbi:MAG TPA: signal peptidase II [Gemmatimonadaceae bacterium]|nr:signal peptidase II [Gemmatimonadaceae bacterium]